jgi:hypothetical protein
MKSKEVYQKHEKAWMKLRKEFETLDYELAMMDGRYKVLPAQGVRVKKVASANDLSVDQILKIAKELGIDLDKE